MSQEHPLEDAIAETAATGAGVLRALANRWKTKLQPAPPEVVRLIRRLEQAASAIELDGEASTALSARDEFISVAAHELRTPLTAVRLKVEGVADALKRLPPLPKYAERLDAAVRQIGRLSDLVDQLIDVTRIARGTFVLSPVTTDLAAVVRDLCDELNDTAMRCGSVLQCEAPPQLVGSWDRGRLEQVLSNLLSNAVNYGAGKPIDVRLEEDARQARLTVVDHGIGIAANDLERIFDRFERAVPMRHTSGLGLGLYVARNIVQAHGGSLQVSSELGKGSTFTIELPKQHASYPARAAAVEVHP